MNRPARPDGWEQRLAAEILAAADRPWAWGSHDCATFAARCARAVLNGPTVWDDLLGRHSTAIGALRVLRALGAAQIDEAADLRAARISPKAAQRGDLVAMPVIENGIAAPALGICLGRDLILAADPFGTILFPMRRAIAAWPIDPKEG
jgi:hypothetical protein